MSQKMTYGEYLDAVSSYGSNKDLFKFWVHCLGLEENDKFLYIHLNPVKQMDKFLVKLHAERERLTFSSDPDKMIKIYYGKNGNRTAHLLKSELIVFSSYARVELRDGCSLTIPKQFTCDQVKDVLCWILNKSPFIQSSPDKWDPEQMEEVGNLEKCFGLMKLSYFLGIDSMVYFCCGWMHKIVYQSTEFSAERNYIRILYDVIEFASIHTKSECQEVVRILAKDNVFPKPFFWNNVKMSHIIVRTAKMCVERASEYEKEENFNKQYLSQFKKHRCA